jgi:hypothetical protein
MIRVRCSNPRRNSTNHQGQQGYCDAPDGIFEFNDHRYANAVAAREHDVGAYSLRINCPFCNFPCIIWIKGEPLDEIYRGSVPQEY